MAPSLVTVSCPARSALDPAGPIGCPPFSRTTWRCGSWIRGHPFDSTKRRPDPTNCRRTVVSLADGPLRFDGVVEHLSTPDFLQVSGQINDRKLFRIGLGATRAAKMGSDVRQPGQVPFGGCGLWFEKMKCGNPLSGRRSEGKLQRDPTSFEPTNRHSFSFVAAPFSTRYSIKCQVHCPELSGAHE
jgi:hypothetical protein